jgi:hypothetical protein
MYLSWLKYDLFWRAWPQSRQKPADAGTPSTADLARTRPKEPSPFVTLPKPLPDALSTRQAYPHDQWRWVEKRLSSEIAPPLIDLV